MRNSFLTLIFHKNLGDKLSTFCKNCWNGCVRVGSLLCEASKFCHKSYLCITPTVFWRELVPKCYNVKCSVNIKNRSFYILLHLSCSLNRSHNSALQTASIRLFCMVYLNSSCDFTSYLFVGCHSHKWIRKSCLGHVLGSLPLCVVKWIENKIIYYSFAENFLNYNAELVLFGMWAAT